MVSKITTLPYVLITPAHNEEAFIEDTIKSVVSQTVLPQRWIIVSDGSTDRTEEIVQKYLSNHSWIELLSLPPRKERHFAAKVLAVKAGYDIAKKTQHELLCCIDADISFEADFFEYLIDKFINHPDLGLAGTDYIEGDFHSFKDSYISQEHVNGACQMFRRECWQDIGGYTPIKGGGIDWVAVMTARMKGWKTRSYQERVFTHLRPIGTAEANKIGARFAYGKKDYFLGNHPLWESFRILFTMTKKPYGLGGLAMCSGYLWAWVSKTKRPISKELVNFHQSEQLKRLNRILKSSISFKSGRKKHTA